MRARALDGGGAGGEYELTGHKWFGSAPMCDELGEASGADARLAGDGGLQYGTLPAGVDAAAIVERRTPCAA